MLFRSGLPPLRDPNDLPDPPEVEVSCSSSLMRVSGNPADAKVQYWVGPGGEKLTGPRPAPTTAPLPVKKRKGAGAPLVSETPEDRALELTAIESRIQSHSSGVEGEPEAVVLTDTEQEKLRQSQVRLHRPTSGRFARLTPPISQIKFSRSQTVWFLPLSSSPMLTAGCSGSEHTPRQLITPSLSHRRSGSLSSWSATQSFRSSCAE